MVGAPDDPAEQDQLDRVVAAQHVEDREARGDDGDGASAQLARQKHRRGPDVEDDAVAVAHHRRRSAGDGALVGGVRRRDDGEATDGVRVGHPLGHCSAVHAAQLTQPLEFDEVAADGRDAHAAEVGELLGGGAPVGAQPSHDGTLTDGSHAPTIASRNRHVLITDADL